MDRSGFVNPCSGHYTVPKPRSEKDRARALEVDEDITRHVPLSDRYVRLILRP